MSWKPREAIHQSKNSDSVCLCFINSGSVLHICFGFVFFTLYSQICDTFTTDSLTFDKNIDNLLQTNTTLCDLTHFTKVAGQRYMKQRGQNCATNKWQKHKLVCCFEQECGSLAKTPCMAPKSTFCPYASRIMQILYPVVCIFNFFMKVYTALIQSLSYI